MKWSLSKRDNKQGFSDARVIQLQEDCLVATTNHWHSSQPPNAYLESSEGNAEKSHSTETICQPISVKQRQVLAFEEREETEE